MLLQGIKGWDFATAAREIEQVVCTVPARARTAGISAAKAIAKASRIWGEASMLMEGDAVWHYLRGRGLALPSLPLSIRTHPGLDYIDDDGVVAGKYPAMLAMIATPDSKAITLHRTYLCDGQKAPVPKPKKILSVSSDMTISGAAVRLSKVGGALGIAEGIESALAASEIHGIPVWSSISAGGMESFEVPAHAGDEVVIFADNDTNFAGQRAAHVLAHKLSLKKYRVKVMTPPNAGTDWLDYLNERR